MKHRYSIFFALAVVVLLSQVVGSATASVDTGLVSNKGPGVELYLPSGSSVSQSEVAIIINYADTDVILKISGISSLVGSENKTYLTQVIEAHTSQILELDFPDLGSYWITVNSGDQTLFGISKERPSFYLPTPRNDSGWHLAPPVVPTDPLTYSAKMVASLIASVTLQTVLIAVVVIAAGAVLGAVVKQITRFLVPWDFLSLIFCAVVLMDIIFHWFDGMTGHDKIWNVALVVGYQMGFWLWRIDYLTPIRTNLKEKTVSFLPIPYYYPDNGEGCCLATQSNKALFKRLFLGVHHRLGTDAGIAMDWQAIGKKPYLPKIHVRALWVEKETVTQETVTWWRFKLTKFQTEYKLAYASGIQKAQWLVNGKAYFVIQDMYERLALAYTELKLRHRSEAVGSSAGMIEQTANTSPAERFKQFFGKQPQEIDLETGEQVLNIIEAAEIEPQEGAEEYAPEQQEEKDNRRPEQNGRGNKPIRKNNKAGNSQNARQANDNDNEEDK